jgi:hypothetical protein
MDCQEERYFSQCKKHGITDFYAMKIAGFYAFGRIVEKPKKIEWKNIVDYCLIYMKNDTDMKDKDKIRFELIVKELSKNY